MANTSLYARDLVEENRTDAFMGPGFVEAYEKAEANGCDLIIGEFYPIGQWTEVQ